MNFLEKINNTITNLRSELKKLQNKENPRPFEKSRMEYMEKHEKDLEELEKEYGTFNVGSEIILSEQFLKLIENIPENNRRKVNKIVKKGDFFDVIYNLNEKKLIIQKKDLLIYSAIPYDTARLYIQRAAVLTLLYPDSTVEYLKEHEQNLKKYIEISLKQVDKPKSEIKKYYNAIFERPLFMIQILGRMLQHDETGALSANLPGKFLYDINEKTGITGYLVEFIKFLVEMTKELPIATNGEIVTLIENLENKQFEEINQNYIMSTSIINYDLLPKPVLAQMQNQLMTLDNYSLGANQPLLKTEVGQAMKNVRKNYVAHSVKPQILEPIFANVLPTKNLNKINVVSDIHSFDGSIPFENTNFNIIAGDISDSKVSDISINGIAVIGNHELSDLVPKESEFMGNFKEFKNFEWFRRLQNDPNEAWPLLPVGNHKFYKIIKEKMSTCYPNMIILNNESYIYEGIKYIGITIPVALVKRKDEVQNFIFDTLTRIIKDDYQTPIVIVSHAPLFNELSFLSQKSASYNKNYGCSNKELYELFEKANIIGAIHGHHHIPASKGRNKNVQFAGKERFIVCSIYSKMNTGFPLETILEKKNKKVLKKTRIKLDHEAKNKGPVIYEHDTPVEKIKGIYEEERQNKPFFTVDKRIKNQRIRKRFENLNDAIDYLNELNSEHIERKK